MIRNIYFLLICLAAISCKTSSLYINVIEPAPVHMPSEVKNVGVINRYLPTEDTKALDAIDRVLSLEGKNLDSDGAAESIKGLAAGLSKNDNLSTITIIDDITFKTSGVKYFPEPLSWDIVQMICNEKNLDVIFALEKYDTDTQVNYSPPNPDVKTSLGKILGVGRQVDVHTFINTGWRIYYPVSKVILDQYAIDESFVFSGGGLAAVGTTAAFISRKESVNNLSNDIGKRYALRIMPYHSSVYRDYYVKGTNNFKIAKRRAQAGNWDGAAELWQKETDNRKAKLAGRACYNMAIANEINGNLVDAINWAQTSYSDYNNKLALNYVRILERRLRNLE